jgi:hypothetical protein
MKSKEFMRNCGALCFELNCGGSYARNGRSACCRNCKGLTAWLLGVGVATGLMLFPQLEPIRSKLSRTAAELIKHTTLNFDNEDNVMFIFYAPATAGPCA